MGTSAELVSDETVSVSLVSSDLSALTVAGSPVLLSARTPTATATVEAQAVLSDTDVVLTASASDVTVQAVKTITMRVDPTTLTLTGSEAASVTVTATLSLLDEETITVELVPNTPGLLTLTPDEVILTRANPSTVVIVSLPDPLPTTEGPVDTVVLRGIATIGCAVVDNVNVVSANSLTVEFMRSVLKFRIRVFLEGALQ